MLNQEPYRKAQILIAFENFGCGRSREHAPWALLDFGIRCIIAPDFADIFFNNSFKNGILPVRLPRAVCEQLMEDAKLGGNARVTVDLERQVVVRPNGEEIHFEIDPFRKHLLLNGLDDIGQTLQHATAIDTYEAKRRQRTALGAVHHVRPERGSRARQNPSHQDMPAGCARGRTDCTGSAGRRCTFRLTRRGKLTRAPRMPTAGSINARSPRCPPTRTC